MLLAGVGLGLAASTTSALAQSESPLDAPPAVPATLRVDGNRAVLEYEGRTLLEAELDGGDGWPILAVLADTAAGSVTQVVKWTAPEGTPGLVLGGTVHASAEAFPVEAEPAEDALRLVRHSVGLSANLRNRAVYDRSRDWLLSVDPPSRVEIVPLDSTDTGIRFRVEARGREVSLRFRPRFYGAHRGLQAFEPWTYRVPRRSVAGWTSWFAFRDAVTEADMLAAAEALGRILAPFGYTVVQLDDGYQQPSAGLPEDWLSPNEKFPSGLAPLAAAIADRGLEPGIWTYASFHRGDFAARHPEHFVRGPDGAPARGIWVGWVVDARRPETVDRLVRPTYRGLREMGWDYFKLDGLRHLRYEGYNSHASDFLGGGVGRGEALRRYVEAVREEIGVDAYLLGSWGIRPELAGLLDACRVGDDGFGFGGFAQYNSFNNVVWRNDPDHVELTSAEASRAVTATTLTGSLLMLTDRPEVWESERIEAAKRAAPVPFTVPGQVYDVDPSRSARLGSVETELSGSGPRPVDAEQRPVADLYLLDVARPFERWSVLGVMDGGPRSLALADLGLDPAAGFHVFEFWSRDYRGVAHDSLTLEAPDGRREIEVLCLRPDLARPQLVATSRHLTCGVPDLEALSWDGAVLAGRSAVVGRDPYVLYLHAAGRGDPVEVEIDGARLVSLEPRGPIVELTLLPDTSRTIEWRLRFGSAVPAERVEAPDPARLAVGTPD